MLYVSSRPCAVLVLLACASLTSAQLAVTGVADKSVYADRVTFLVPAEPGFSYAIKLNTNSVGADVPVVVASPDYYELRAQRTEGSTGAVTNLLVRFIVKDSARADTEWGLPSQTPWPIIQSSSNEFAGAHLVLMTPRRFPAGYEIPVVAWAEDENGHAVRGNGLLNAPGHPAIQLRRGVGSGFLSATNPPGELVYSAEIAGLRTNKLITLENNTAWTDVSGTLAGAIEWPPNSRIHVTNSLLISAGATLTIGAGSVVRLDYRTDITNNGAVIISGSLEDPVVFMPNSSNQPWGGFLMRNNTGSIAGTGALFTASGAEQNWFGSGGNPGSHRKEQALFFVQQSQSVSLADSAAIYLAGQLGHAVSGGTFTFSRFLLQHTTSGGEFTGASFTVNDSAFIECPDATFDFVDGDNDALYLVSGTHGFTNTLFGWTKDDGIDSGGDGVGRLHYERCWFEAIFHEGNSLSGLKDTTAHETVYLDCGQGLEDGYGAGTGGPTGRVDRCLFACCQVGARHGDNYASIGNGYPGIIAATNSLFLHNHHDLFGYDWRSFTWTNAVGQMFFSSNLFTLPDPDFPANAVWDPSSDASRLAPFGAAGLVGLGFAVRPGQTLADFPDGLPVGLSMFCTNEVTVEYAVDLSDTSRATGTLHFPAGQLRQFIPLPPPPGPGPSAHRVLRVRLFNGRNAEITSTDRLYFQSFGAQTIYVLIPFGSKWRYLDDGSNQGSLWTGNNFDDRNWPAGFAELGFGDKDETTPLRQTNSVGATNITFYFRAPVVVGDPAVFSSLQMSLRRDDGGVVYFHGAEVFRSTNMPPGLITSSTFATATGENTVDTTNLPPSVLQPGTNVVAVEIHQQSLTSSDISFDFQLIASLPPPPPRLESAMLDDELILYWADPAFTLERADELNSPAWVPAGGPSPVPVAATSARQFYRLRR
ncbi:MAG TPA: hypothetical protein VJA21_33445 [Verrucomicrobiae bacterium]